MALPGKLLRLLGIVVGLAMLGAGVLGVIFLSKPPPEPMARVPVRPVKTTLVGGPVPMTQRRYPGKVQAADRAQLSFDVSGTVLELPVKSGQQVKKGEVLAKLDPRDYQSAFDAKQAIENERRVNMERDRELFDKGIVSKSELDLDIATYDVAKSNTALARKALEDAVLRAPFDGTVAYTIVRQFQNVVAKEPILSLQDQSKLEIVIHLPEQVVALTAADEKGRQIMASFDFFPGRQFPMKVKEYATEADPATQTYPVTLSMTAPADVMILPGMSATVSVSTPPILAEKAQGYLLPLTAVPADGQGKFYVWLVEPAQEGLFAVRRQGVSVGPMSKDYVMVTQGVDPKQRVVTAGVHLLEDGQQVKLLGPEQPEGKP